jgi:hypothetical protein
VTWVRTSSNGPITLSFRNLSVVAYKQAFSTFVVVMTFAMNVLCVAVIVNFVYLCVRSKSRFPMMHSTLFLDPIVEL